MVEYRAIAVLAITDVPFPSASIDNLPRQIGNVPAEEPSKTRVSKDRRRLRLGCLVC